MDPLTVKCTKCGSDRDPSWFSRDTRRRSWRTPWCKPCLRAAHRQRTTGLSPEAYEKLLADQGRCCGICRLAFDEDHPARVDRSRDGLVRGLLCARCKVGVSTFQDDVDRLRAAVGYLARRTADSQMTARKTY